jgi:DNA-directed RNA polymerase specialized sigma24 family protein
MPSPDTRWHLVWQHRPELLRVARRRTPTLADAEDCVSEAMLRTALHPDLDPERVGAFLTAVTLRLCADLHRERARTARIAARHTGDERLVPTPEAVVCDRAEASWLAGRVTRTMTERERAAVRAKAYGAAPCDASALARARAKARG